MSISDYAGVTSAALQNIGTIASSIYAANQARAATEDEYKYQLLLNDQQNQFTKEMWALNNAYNDPSQQIARYLNAGINPGAAVQSVTGNHYNSQAAQATSSPGVSANYGQVAAQAGSQIAQSLGSIMQNLLVSTQIDNIKADTEAKKIENSYKPEYQKTVLDTMRSEQAEIWARIDSIFANSEKSKVEKDLLDNDNEYRDSFNKQKLKLNDAELEQIHSSIEKMYEDLSMAYDRLQIDKSDYVLRTKYYQLQQNLTEHQADLFEKQGIKVSREARNLLQEYNNLVAEGRLTEAKTYAQRYENAIKKSADSGPLQFSVIGYMCKNLIPYFYH